MRGNFSVYVLCLLYLVWSVSSHEICNSTRAIQVTLSFHEQPRVVQRGQGDAIWAFTPAAQDTAIVVTPSNSSIDPDMRLYILSPTTSCLPVFTSQEFGGEYMRIHPNLTKAFNVTQYFLHVNCRGKEGCEYHLAFSQLEDDWQELTAGQQHPGIAYHGVPSHFKFVCGKKCKEDMETGKKERITFSAWPRDATSTKYLLLLVRFGKPPMTADEHLNASRGWFSGEVASDDIKEGTYYITVIKRHGLVPIPFVVSVTLPHSIQWLKLGRPTFGVVKKNSASFYKFYVDSADTDIEVYLTKLDGDPDCAMSHEEVNQRPAHLTSQWRSATQGDDEIIVASDDPKRRLHPTGWFHIGVHSAEDATFSIIAFAEKHLRPAAADIDQGKDGYVIEWTELWLGLPQAMGVQPGRPANFLFFSRLATSKIYVNVEALQGSMPDVCVHNCGPDPHRCPWLPIYLGETMRANPPEQAVSFCREGAIRGYSSERQDLEPPEDRCEAGSSFEQKRWLEPQVALEAVQRLSSGSFSLAPARKAPPFGQRRCRLLGFWGTSGEEINEEMRWDGTTYSCHLEIPAREDAMFQVLVEGVGRMYPSIEGANLSIRHELLGPEEAHHDAAWFLDSARSKRRAWIFVACPQSCAVCLGWKFQGEEIPKETEDWREMGPWLISSHIGQGKQGAVVCTGRWPSAGKGGVAAVKYPVEAEELELYARVHDIPGLPDLLDFGRLPGPRTEKGEFYMAMSKIEPCLDILLRGQLHIHDTSPQTLGRISWPVVAGMGLRLLRTLQAIHKRGILHCDLKPGNILLHRRAPHVQLIDLGRAGYLGRTAFKAGEGGMRDYMSIKAGLEGGQRTSADDMESLGWFLLRLLLGRFPWSAKVKPHPDETWLEGGVRVARDKLRFLEEGGVKRFAPECRYCPPFLLAFLRRSRAAAGHVLADAEYETLAELLVSESGNGNLEPSEAAEKNLEQFVSGYFAARDEGILRKGMWPYAGGCTLHWLFLTEEFPSKTAAMAAGIKRLQVSPGLLLRLTGEKVEIDDCVWMELDPVWSPGVPELLLKPGWVLAIGSSPQGGLVETWVEWGLEFPVVEHVKGVLDKSE